MFSTDTCSAVEFLSSTVMTSECFSAVTFFFGVGFLFFVFDFVTVFVSISTVLVETPVTSVTVCRVSTLVAC
jgi:hypothetical protein